MSGFVVDLEPGQRETEVSESRKTEQCSRQVLEHR
jgi:hypothetical protein